MAKYRNLAEYCKKSNITLEELKECITNAALALSSSAAHVLTAADIEAISYPLHEFNDIINSME